MEGVPAAPAMLFALFAAATATTTPATPTAVTLAVPSTGGSECPSPAQLTEAIGARVPGLLVTPPATPTAAAPAAVSSLRLATTTLPEGDLRVELFDAQGESLLHRLLPAPPHGHAADCPAFAETVALIVERYLHDVGYEAPPLAPPPPRVEPAPPPPAPAPPPSLVATPAPPPPRPARVTWRLGLGAQGRLGDAGGWDGDGELALGVEGAGAAPHFGARLSVGVAPAATARWTDQALPQSATLRRLPARLGLFLRIPLGAGQLEPGLGGGVDALFVTRSDPETASEHHLAPFGDLALGYTVTLIGPVYLRGLSRVALTVPYDFKNLAHANVWETPRLYGELGLESGFAFP
jgi:hypothetical protein